MEMLILLMADFANVDQSGKLNVLGAFGRIYAANFPAKHPSMHLIVKLGTEITEIGGEKEFSVHFLNQDGQELVVFPPIRFDVPSPTKGQKPEINFIVQIRDLVLPEPGIYQFSVFVDKKEIGELPLTVEQFTPQQG